MNNKVELIYENGEYSVALNGAIVNVDKDIENSFSKFKQVISNNVTAELKTWENIQENMKKFIDKGVEINSEYRTITYGVMKYFYNMGKVFYMANGGMIPLRGGYELFDIVLDEIVSKGENSYEDFLEFCKEILERKANYRITDASIVVLSASFNYGSCEYNFNSNKINKGASITKGSFDEFKKYVLEII